MSKKCPFCGGAAEVRERFSEYVNVAIAALEKQMPKKPMKIIDVYNKDLYKLDCPACGGHIAYGNSRVGTLHKCTVAPDRCGYCGQALDFSEWEEGEG